MTILIQRTWTQANGTPWTDDGWSKIYGGVSVADIQSNRGNLGPNATERIYRIDGFPQVASHKFDLDADWSNAGGTARIIGMGVRWTSDGRFGYVAEVDSNLGTAMLRIRKRVSGSWSTLMAAIDVSADLTTAILDAGTTLTLRVENTDADTVNLQVLHGATVLASQDDTAANRIEGGGTVAVLIGPNATLADITVDNLNVKDFEDEYAGTASDLDDGVALVVDGTSYAWDDLVALGINITMVSQSYTNQTPMTVTDSLQFQEASTVLFPGAWVEVALDGVVVAAGKLAGGTSALTTAEGHSFTVRGPEDLASSVPIEHPTTRAGTLLFNLPDTHADYDAALAGMTLGEIIAYLLDNHAEGDGGLRDQGAAAPDGDLYVQAELDLLTDIVPEIHASGDVYGGVQAVLAHTEYLLKIVPGTRVWTLDDRSGAQTDVDIGADHVTGDIRTEPVKAVTAIVLRGTRPEITETVLNSEAVNELDKGWVAGLEATHNSTKQWKNQDTGLVTSSSTVGGKGVMTPDAVGPPTYSMEISEWIGCLLTFEDGPEAGNQYTVLSNTAAALTVTTAWAAGGPAIGNTFVVRGDKVGGGQDNGHRIIGRRWTLSDVNLGISEGVCATAKIRNGEFDFPVKISVNTPTDPLEAASVELDLPAIGMIDNVVTPDPCLEGDTSALTVAEVEVTLPTYDRGDPSVPYLRIPTLGFTGSAFSFDSAKWATEGAHPGQGDYGIQNTLSLNIPAFTGTAAHVTAYTSVLNALLEVLSPLPRAVTIVIKGKLDTQWAGLGKRLTISDSGGRTTGFESEADFVVVGVQWNPVANTTTVLAGSQGAGEYDVDALRRTFATRAGVDNLNAVLRNWEDLLACVKQAVGGTDNAAAPSPQQTCATHVTSSVTKPGRNVVEDLEGFEKVVIGLGAAIAADKGGVFSTDPDGDIWWTHDDGSTFELHGDGTWQSGTPGALTPLVDGGDAGFDDLDDLGGLEGALWSAIQGIAANLGKTIDTVTGDVIAPGTTNDVASNPDGNPWVQYGPGGSTTTVTSGNDVPGTTLGGDGGVLANLGKSVGDNGETLESDAPTPGPPYGTYYPPNYGGPIPLLPGSNVPTSVTPAVLGNLHKTNDDLTGVAASGDTVGASGATSFTHADADGAVKMVTQAAGNAVPASMHQMHEAVAARFGLSISTEEDPAGVVWTGA